MSEPFIGQIMVVGFNFPPRSWASCEGQLLSIAQNTALFSLLGTTFGGNGRTDFALPDLRGRTIVGQGSGPGLTPISRGERGGVETHTQVLQHNHTATLHAESATANTFNPSNALLAITTTNNYAGAVPADELPMHEDSITVANAGSGTSYVNRGPFLGLQINIALTGIFPSRN